MKAAIVLLAVLIIGSNAQINTNATAAVAQANELLNSFQNQTSQNINATADTINANLGEIAKVFVDLSQNLTGLKQGRSSNSAAQIQSVIILITGLNLGIPDANALLAPVIANLASQIAVLVNPTIDTLGSAITNGTTTLSCFTNEVPKIAENIAEAVAFVANVVLTDTSKVVKIVTGFVDSLRAQANDILVEAQKCPGGLIGELLCLPPLVSL